jgi:hypothetical protein
MDQASEAEIRTMQAKVEKTEQGQQKIMSFLQQAVSNPAFLHQLLNAHQANNRMSEEGVRARNLPPCSGVLVVRGVWWGNVNGAVNWEIRCLCMLLCVVHCRTLVAAFAGGHAVQLQAHRPISA